MENKLQLLMAAGGEVNRVKWALEWKKQGRKVIGVLCSYVPEEIVWAAGMLPWRVAGSWRPGGLASMYRHSMLDVYSTHVLESVLAGDVDFLDGVIGTNWDDDARRLTETWRHTRKTAFTPVMHIPYMNSALAQRKMAIEITRLLSLIEQSFHLVITAERLRQAVGLYNHMRRLVMRLYELRKRERPPLSGAEFLGITTAAMVMPKDLFVEELEALLPYLETRQVAIKSVKPRILVSSDRMDDPRYLGMIEDIGCLVAMDDLDTGSRYFWKLTESDSNDLVTALAKRYLSRPECPRQYDYDGQARQVIEWVKGFNIDAVIELQVLHSYPRSLRSPYFRRKLTEAGIAAATFQREYVLANVAQLQTRIGAVLEMLS